MSSSNAQASSSAANPLSPAQQACAYIWYTPYWPANLVLAQQYIDELPPIKVHYLKEPVSASCVKVVPSEGDVRGALLLRLTDADLQSHLSAHLKLEAVAKLLKERGHQVMLASSPGHDLNVELAFFICRDDAERIVTRQPPRVFARALLNSTIKAHSPEMHHAWFIVRDMGDHGRHTLMGHVLVATPADASYLVDHGEFTAADVNHGDYDLTQYLISFERPRGYLQQTGMNELVVPMRAARRFSPGDDEVALNDIAKQIQSAIKRSSPSRILGCGSIDSPESVTVWDLQFALFHCSHPVLADMLSKTRLHAGFTPAFTFHTNLEEKKWKLKSMREYSEDQEKQQRDKRRSLVELLPVRSPRRGSHTAEEKDGLIRSIKMLKAISDSRISNDGQLENHLQELAECEEEQVRLRELRAVARASGSTQSASVTTAKSAPDSMSAPEGNPTVGPPPHQLTEGHHPIRDPRLRSSTSQSLPSPKELSIPSSVEKTPDLESVADDQETVGPANKRARLA